MAFDVAPDSYDRFMGRWSSPLAEQLVDRLGLTPESRVLDVGCGPGALTAVLVDRLGAPNVSAVEPSATFRAATRERFPDVDVRQAAAEALPFEDDVFDAVAAGLVVPFMSDAVAGLTEMRRVARPGRVVAATAWAQGRGPLNALWRAAQSLDRSARDEGLRPGCRPGELEAMFERAELGDVRTEELTVTRTMTSFEDWWEPVTFGVGPAGDYVRRLDDAARAALREECIRTLPEAPFDLSVTAFCATGRA